MALFLITSTPLAGLALLYTFFPEWYRDRRLFPAGGRAFLWFWAGIALAFILGGRGIDRFGQKEYFFLHWLYYDLLPVLAAAAGFMVWKPLRTRELHGEKLLSAAMIYGAVFSMFSGAAEAVLWFSRYDGYALFFRPLVLIARMLCIISAVALYGHFDRWKRWFFTAALLMAFSLAGAAGPAVTLRNRYVAAGALGVVLLAAAFFLLWLVIRTTAFHYRRADAVSTTR